MSRDTWAEPLSGEPDAVFPPLAGGWELRTYDLPGGARIELRAPRDPDRLLDDEAVQERNRFNDSMPYWAWIWDSAPTMARLLAAEEWPRGTRVLELGAGLGLVGIAVAAAHRAEVVLTDHDPLAVQAAMAQAAACGVPGVSATSFDWNDPESAPGGPFDAVLGCDVLYEGGFHAPLLDLFGRLLAPGGVAWLADPGRVRLPRFVERAEARGYGVEVRDADGRPAAPEAGAFRLLRLVAPG